MSPIVGISFVGKYIIKNIRVRRKYKKAILLYGQNSELGQLVGVCKSSLSKLRIRSGRKYMKIMDVLHLSIKL